MDSHMQPLTESTTPALAQRLSVAADACDAAAARVRDGLPIVAELRTALGALEQVAHELATRDSASRMRAAGVPPTADPATAPPDAAAEQAARLARRMEAAALLDQVRHLHYTHDPDPTVLQAMQQLHRRTDLIAAADADVATGQHPLAELLTLVRGHGQLPIDALADLTRRVTAVFGRPLAIAALMGRLVLPPGVPPTNAQVDAAPDRGSASRSPDEPSSVPSAHGSPKNHVEWMTLYRDAIEREEDETTLHQLRDDALHARGSTFDEYLAHVWVDVLYLASIRHQTDRISHLQSIAEFVHGHEAALRIYNVVRLLIEYREAVFSHKHHDALISASYAAISAASSTETADLLRNIMIDCWIEVYQQAVHQRDDKHIHVVRTRAEAAIPGIGNRLGAVDLRIQAERRLDHCLPALQPASSWMLYIDETGSRFRPDAGSQEEPGWIVLLAVPAGVKFPKGLSAAMHASEAKPKQIGQAIEWVQQQRVGILGFQAQGGVVFPNADWRDAVMQTVSIALRLLPLPTDGSPTTVRVIVERRTPSVSDEAEAAANRASTAALQQELALRDPARARALTLSLTMCGKGVEPGLAIVDAVAHTQSAIRQDAWDRRRRWELDACFLDKDAILLVRRALDAFGPTRYPSGDEWRSLLQDPDALDRRSIVGSLLLRLHDRCRQDVLMWERYLTAAQGSLEDKGFDVALLARQATWLEDAAPLARFWRPTAIQQLAQGMYRLAVGNRQGDTARDGDAVLQQTRALIAENARISCLAALYVATRRTNQFEFAAASSALEDWLQLPDVATGLALRGRLLSSLGQHRAFVGQHQEARKYFDEALARFEMLSDPAERAREQRQTAVYRALASLDDATLADTDRRPLLEAAGVDLRPAQIRELAATGDGESRWRHHLLVRYLAERCDDSHVLDAYLTASDWGSGQLHPWGLIKAWRGVLLLRNPSARRRTRAAACFNAGITRYGGPLTRGTARLIGLTIHQAAYCAGLVSSPPERDEIAALRWALPAAQPAIDALTSARVGSDPMDVLRAVLPFNVR